MFGYIKPTTISLTEEEQQLYKAIYCGLCHSLKKVSGQLSRFTLNYDFVLLALLQMAAKNETPAITVRRCISHPYKGCSVAVTDKTLDYCAALSVLLVYESIRDSVQDEKGFSRIKARLALIPARRFLKKANKRFDLPALTVREHLQKLSELEKRGCDTPDEAADVFGNLLSSVSVFGIGDDMMQFAVSKIMFHIGKWIYLIDAADDFEKDKAEGKFNPFLPNGPDPGILANSLEWELSHCDNILDKMPACDPMIRNIIRNILFIGTAAVSQRILFQNRK